MILDYKTLIKEWIVIYKCVKAEDLSLNTLQRLCIEDKVNLNNCYQHYLIINRISYRGGKKIAIECIEKYMTLLEIKEKSKYEKYLSLYEIHAGHILSILKNY